MKSKMSFKPLLLLVSILAFINIGKAQVDNYKYRRAITNIDNQFNKIIMPDDIYEHLGKSDLSDIRIYGFTNSHDTIEVPYIPSEVKYEESIPILDYKIFNKAKVKEGYSFIVEISKPTFINEITIDSDLNNFDWRVSIEGSENLQKWGKIVSDYRILSIKTNSIDYQYTKVIIPTSNYRYYKITINSQKDPQIIGLGIINQLIKPNNLKEYIQSKYSISIDKENEHTQVKIDLGYKVPVSEVMLDVVDSIDYYRPITIKALVDSIKTDKGWHHNYKTVYLGTLSSLEESKFYFEEVITSNISVTILNEINQPLTVRSGSASGYAKELIARFNDEGSEYYMYYGNNNSQKAHYDLVHFKDNIPLEINTITLGNEEILSSEKEKNSSFSSNKLCLYVLMGLLIILLGWFTLKMMKEK